MTTQSRNSGTLNTQSKSGVGLIVNDATFSVDDAMGIVDAPFALTSMTRNTGTLTPQTKS